ncbi:hypothetical protein TRICI_005731 [Trichomonascus ciferrii]|uniref:Uncharacterized protein n=1 Tax=Trichomonascus ciferrii TaxID=44093 RepID=A0A642UPZ9_9ASCO|nr:hypothetical protein TRICI_005731 [Trichomonascus ciferrii]
MMVVVEASKLLCLTLLSGQVFGAAVFGNSVEGVIMARDELETSKEQVSGIQNGIMQLVEMLEKNENNEQLVKDSIKDMESHVKEGVSVISRLDNVEDMKMMFGSFVDTVVKGALALDDSISKSPSMAVEDEQNLSPLMDQLRQLSVLGIAVDGDLTNLDMAVARMDQSVMMKRDEVGLVARQYGLGRPPTAQEKSSSGGSPILEMGNMINNMVMKRDSGGSRPSQQRPKPPSTRPKEPQDYYRTPDVKPQQPDHNYDIPPYHPGERPPPQPTRYPLHGPPDGGRPPSDYYQYDYQGKGDYGYYGGPDQYAPPYPYLDPSLNEQHRYDGNRRPPQAPPGHRPSPIRGEPYYMVEPQIKPTPRMAIEDDDIDPLVVRYNPNIDEDYANFIGNRVD